VGEQPIRKRLERRDHAPPIRVVDWFNHSRLLEPIGHVPPAEFEAAYYRTEGSRKDRRKG
jgi:transposase InsO family protein